MKKSAGLLILFFVIASVMLPVFASGPDNFKKVNKYVPGQFDDVKPSDWFSPNVANAYELGLMIGSGETHFNSYGNVTIAEAITMAARIHSVYTKGSDKFEKAALWYRPYLDYAVWNGVIDGKYPDYGKAATRAEFAVILAGALPGEALEAINTVVDGSIPDVDLNAAYGSKVYKLYRAGILAGNDAYGTFTPGSNIARAAAAAIVTRMADASLRVKINLEEAVQILYAADGRTRITLRSEVEAYLKVGWYKEPVIIMYAPDGRTRYTLRSEIDAYLKAGWYKEPVKITYENKKLNYSWEYDDYKWTYNTEIPADVYNAYKSIDRNIIGNYYNLYITHTSDDQWMSAIAQTFYKEKTESGYEDYQIIELMISFVQSLKYISDDIGTGYDEYPKFPLETLYDQGGDCEDTSILLASLIRELGYGVVLVIFDDHMGVAVLGEPTIEGYYYEYDGLPYYYVETTSPGWQIGELPSELIGEAAMILPT